jgi:serine/threonine protein kinase
VQVLHAEGIVHRDIKPTNLLLDDKPDDSRVLVADLGSAKMLADASGLTVTTGTPAYMAPEQADQSGGFDARADVYALGVVAYELVSGRRPFADISAAAVMARSPQVRAEPIAGDLDLDPDLDVLLAAALSRDPGQRPASAAELGDRLTALAAGPDRTPGDRQRSRDWPALLVVAAAVLAFVLSTAIAWLLH